MRQSRRQVKITERDLAILRKLGAAGWLTTGQIRNYFFERKSLNAVSKRLRKLVSAKYLAMVRYSRTETGLYRLTSRGKLVLINLTEIDERQITISAQLPRKLHHFLTVNDIRQAFDRIRGAVAHLCYFYSEQELWRCEQQAGCAALDVWPLLKHYRLIPDAIAQVQISQGNLVRKLNLFVEYDAETEHPTFFGRTKIRQYAALLAQYPRNLGEVKVLTFTPTIKRLVRLMRQTVAYQPPPHLFYFALLDQIQQEQWETAEIFLDPGDFFLPVRNGDRLEVWEKEQQGEKLPQFALAGLPALSPYQVSPREERGPTDNPCS